MQFPDKTLILFITAYLLGVRHGVDWDHIAAITDITGTSQSKRQSIILGSFYVIGHATVIVILGFIAVLIGITLPIWVDQIMEPFVGITLILLGFWLIYSILLHGQNFRMKSRWMLAFAIVGRLYDFLQEKISHKHKHPHLHYPQKYGRRTAYTIGLIHGIGAETPTQVLIFLTAAGIGGSWVGSLLVLTFVFGLFTSNSIITLVSAFGYAKTQRNTYMNLILGIITALFSLIVGGMFLFKKASFLPAIFAG